MSDWRNWSPYLDSPRNPRVVAARRLLTDPRERRRRARSLVEGVRLVGEALRAGYVVQLFADPGRPGVREVVAEAVARGVTVTYSSPRVMTVLCDTEHPQGVAAEVILPQAPELASELGAAGLLLWVEGLQDPGNLGTLIRAAAGAGADAVVVGGASADPWNPKCVRASAGAIFHIPVMARSEAEPCDVLALRMRSLGWRLGGLDAHEGVAYYTADLASDRLALVVGSEARGLSPEMRKACDLLLRIPMAHATESLNAAVAASVVLFEAVRQRGGVNPATYGGSAPGL